jgi:hypothetical protein
MKRTLKAIVAAATLATVAGTADAQMYNTTPTAGGYWGTSAGINDQQVPMCEAHTSWGNGTTSLMLKNQQNHPENLFLHITNTGWQIPYHQPITVQLQVDSAPVLTLRGFGVAPIAGAGTIEILIGANDPSPISNNVLVVDLFNLLASGVSLHVYFPNGTEAPWSTSLHGAAAALHSFSRCVVALNPPTTQPYAAARTSQPF